MTGTVPQQRIDPTDLETCLRVLGQRKTFLLRQNNRQHAVLHGIITEDIGETGGDDAADAKVVPTATEDQS